MTYHTGQNQIVHESDLTKIFLAPKHKQSGDYNDQEKIEEKNIISAAFLAILFKL